MASPRGKLIFDDRCGFCQKSIQLLRRLDWFGTIEFVPLGQAAELMERHAITSQAMETAMHHISPLGQVTSGAEAFRVFGKLIPPLLPCALLLHLPFALRLAAAKRRANGRCSNSAQGRSGGISFPKTRNASAPEVTWPSGEMWCIAVSIAWLVMAWRSISSAAWPSGTNSMVPNQSRRRSSWIDFWQKPHRSSKINFPRGEAMKGWWAQRDLNPRPSDYESPALTTELWARSR